MGSEVESSSSPRQIHFLFFPLMSPGHMIPMVDMARLFAERGVRSTIVTTPANAVNIRRSVDSATALGHPISLLTIPFPDPKITGLPAGGENLATVPSSSLQAFCAALFLFANPLAALLRELSPDVLVSDSLFTFTADLAADLSIPRLIFHGAGAFPLFVTSTLFHYLINLPEGQDTFELNGLPHKIKLHKKGLPDLFENHQMLRLMGEAENKSYGVVINTYAEMEPTYVDYYKASKPTWCVGPVSLCLRSGESDAAERGEPVGHTNANKISTWLDAKPAGSVFYVCFGSISHLGAEQLSEIARGLEASGENFLWVVRKEVDGEAADEREWLPEGLEERVAERGLIWRGWAPQVVVLAHPAVGWFVTHCGWNSVQEAVVSGVPMLTWPLFHEQFINAELVVEVLAAGLRVWEGFRRNEVVPAADVEAALRKAAARGEVVEGVRRRVAELSEKARAAVQPGGSTYEDIGRLIEHVKAKRTDRSKPSSS